VNLEDRSRPDESGSETMTIAAVNTILPPADDIAPAYIVIVVSPYGQPRRRPYLSLHSASQAVQRAHKRGLDADLVLCKLTPIGAADLDLDGEVAS
jgi:hypothetical protein